MIEFTWVDWLVVAAFFAFATWIGHRQSGAATSLRDFFLGGRRLPWYAVSASIVATEVSAVTFISLPAVVFRDGGNLTYLQLGLIGSLIARLVIGYVLVPAYFEREIYSPYDYMGERLGRGARRVATALFVLGGVLAQSSRVYLTALVLQVLLRDELGALAAATHTSPLALAVAIIAVVAIAWTFAGGMTAIIWTDAILFVVFLGGLLTAGVVAVNGVEGGFAEVWRIAVDAGKTRVLDFSLDPTQTYTFWVALFAASWWNIGAYGVDQLMAQRMFCCAGPREARKAILWAYVSIAVAVLAAFVGMGLYAYYLEQPLTGRGLELFNENSSNIFPIFILEAIPTGIKGLIIAGVFAAAVSSLDSILAALSQTVLAVWMEWRGEEVNSDGARDVRSSRILVVVFGLLLAAAAVGMERVAERYDSILDLALSLATYTQGALLAGFFLGFWRRGWDGSGFVWSAPLSVMTVYAITWHNSASQVACAVFAGVVLFGWVSLRVVPEVRLDARRVLTQSGLLLLALAGIFAATKWGSIDGKPLAFAWCVPIGSLVAYGFGVILAKPAVDVPRDAVRTAPVVPSPDTGS